MNINSVLSAAGIAIISGNSHLDDVIHSTSQGQRAIVFFYNEKCEYTRGMVQPYIDIYKTTHNINFYGFNAIDTQENLNTAKKYGQISPNFMGFICSKSFGGFFGDNKDSLKSLVSYLGSSDNTC